MSTFAVRRSVDPPLNARAYPIEPFGTNPSFLPGGLNEFNYQLLNRNTNYTNKVVLSKRLSRRKRMGK